MARETEPVRAIKGAAYVSGTAGVALVAGLFAGDKAALDALYGAAETTIGQPGGEHTGDPRWKQLARRIVAPLLAERYQFPSGVRLWVPHLYGRTWAALLGAARGYAGIAYSILSCRKLLDEIDLTSSRATSCERCPLPLCTTVTT